MASHMERISSATGHRDRVSFAAGHRERVSSAARHRERVSSAACHRERVNPEVHAKYFIIIIIKVTGKGVSSAKSQSKKVKLCTRPQGKGYILQQATRKRVS